SVGSHANDPVGGRPPVHRVRPNDALVPPTFLLLRVRPLGCGDAELPAAAPDAGRPDRRHPPAALPGADPGESGPHPDVPDAARGRQGVTVERLPALP